MRYIIGDNYVIEEGPTAVVFVSASAAVDILITPPCHGDAVQTGSTAELGG